MGDVVARCVKLSRAVKTDLVLTPVDIAELGGSVLASRRPLREAGRADDREPRLR
jgi:hypothetical protein